MSNTPDLARAHDGASVGATVTLADTFGWKAHATIRKWHQADDYDAGLDPDEVLEVPGNVLLNAGITRLLNLTVGAGGTAYNATNSRIGVGSSTTAAVATQTDLQAATGAATRQWKLVSSAPSVSAQTATFVASFASGEANFAWEEWGIDNGTADGTAASTAPMLNRKVQAMGTKASGAVWTLTATITVA